MSASKDGGNTWGSPVRVNAGSGQHFKPWIVAGTGGSVAIAWWGTPDSVAAPWNAVNAKWYVYLSISSNALQQTPTFSENRVADVPFHIGSICAHTYTCAETNNTNGEHLLADFFQLEIDTKGWVNVVWPDTAHYNGTTSHIFFAKQVSGPNVAGASVTTTIASTSTTSTSSTTTTATTTSSTTSSTSIATASSSTVSSHSSTSTSTAGATLVSASPTASVQGFPPEYIALGIVVTVIASGLAFAIRRRKV